MHRVRRSNPLALAVMVTLAEGPRHPYEIAQTLKRRHHDESIRLNFGSLYSVVNVLERAGLIAAEGVERDQRRPERTVYALTPAGHDEADDWLGELLATPAKEYLQFEAALTMVGAVAPGRVVDLLGDRIVALDAEIAGGAARLALLVGRHELPRLFVLEAEYQQALLVAEVAFVRALVAEITAGTFPGLAQWQAWHDGRSTAVHPPIPVSAPRRTP